MPWLAAQEEAAAYAVFDADLPEPYGIPVVFQSGSVSIDGCEHPYLIMQRLGPDLEALINQGTITQHNFLQVLDSAGTVLLCMAWLEVLQCPALHGILTRLP